MLFILLALHFAFFGCCSAFNVYTGNTALNPPLEPFKNATQFGVGTGLSYNGDVGAVSGIDFSSGIPFVAIYYLTTNGSYQFGQVLTGNPIANFSLYASQDLQWGPVPVRFSANADILVWGWTNQGVFEGTYSNLSRLGEVYVYYYSNGNYYLSQTLTEPVASLPTARVFGSDVRLSSSGQLLVIAAPTFYTSGTSSTPSRVYTYQLKPGWPPVYTAVGYLSHPLVDDEDWGFQLGSDSTLNTLAVGAAGYTPPGHTNPQGAVYLYQLAANTGNYTQTDFITYPTAPTAFASIFGYAVDVDPSCGQLAIGQPVSPASSIHYDFGAAWAYGLSPLSGNHSAGQNVNVLNNTSPAYGHGQGFSISASGNNGRVIAVGVPNGPYDNGTYSSVYIWERNGTSPIQYNLTSELTSFGGVPASATVSTNVGTSVIVSQDNSTVLIGAPGLLGQSKGFAYFYRNSPAVSVPGPTCNLNLASVLPLSSPLPGIRCDATAGNAYSVNLAQYFAANPTLNPCMNQTSGLGTVYSYASYPAGFVTPGGVLNGNNGATCGTNYTLATVYFSCTAASSWNCLPLVLAAVTQDPAANNTARPTLQTLNNVVYIYGTSAIPSSGLSGGAIAGIVIGALAVVGIAAFFLVRECNGERKPLTGYDLVRNL